MHVYIKPAALTNKKASQNKIYSYTPRKVTIDYAYLPTPLSLSSKIHTYNYTATLVSIDYIYNSLHIAFSNHTTFISVSSSYFFYKSLSKNIYNLFIFNKNYGVHEIDGCCYDRVHVHDDHAATICTCSGFFSGAGAGERRLHDWSRRCLSSSPSSSCRHLSCPLIFLCSNFRVFFSFFFGSGLLSFFYVLYTLGLFERKYNIVIVKKSIYNINRFIMSIMIE